MYKINQEQFAKLPDELKALYVKLPNPSSEEVRECFPDSKAGNYKGEGSKSGGIWSESTGKPAGMEYGDSGNASRFFKSIIYQAKASKSERNKGCEGLEEKESTKNFMIGCEDKGNNVDSSIRKYETPKNQNNHPTVKPIALMEYLIKMVTPKGGIVLDPFSGSFSTGVACVKNGFGFVGIEREEEYVVIGKARLEQAQKEKEEELKEVSLFQNL
jgi:DNA modification methylase